jgi:hypothetical protein
MGSILSLATSRVAERFARTIDLSYYSYDRAYQGDDISLTVPTIRSAKLIVSVLANMGV